MNKTRFFTFILTIICLLCTTSALQAKIVERSAKRMPDWVGNTTEDKSKLYFSGSSSGQKSFETARKLAIADALTQLAESMDLTLSVNSKKLITDTGNYLEDKSYAKSRNVKILNTKVKKVYYEKDDTGGNITYNVFVQVSYDKKEYEAEKARLAKEYADVKQNIANLMIKADTLFESASYKEALDEYFTILKMIYEYGTDRDKESAILAKINSLLSNINFKTSYNEENDKSGLTLVCEAYFEASDNSKPYSKASFNLLSGGIETETLTTDDKGCFSCAFGRVSFLKKSLYEFELDLKKTYNLDDEFYKNYSFKQVSVKADTLGNGKTIILRIKAEGKDNIAEDFSEVIKSDLSKNGLVIVKQDGELLLEIKIKFVDTVQNKLKGSGSADLPLFLSNATVSGELLLTNGKKHIAASFSDVKGFGRTEDKSYDDLIRRISNFLISSL